jgi:ElaB/YqjD/DUF883 family membrane-anchored ribosome-binding protein
MYRNRVFGTFALTVALGGCASAAPPPSLPPPTDIEELVGGRPPLPDIPRGLADGPDRNVTNGQCKGLPAGLWVSERKFAERIAAVAERDRLRREVDAYVKLHRLEREIAEQLERDSRQALGMADRRAETRLWIGIGVGAAAILLGGLAVARVGQ